MKLELKREWKTATAIVGELLVDGVKFCYTLEPTARLIPAGTYDLSLYTSPARGYTVPLLKGVPGRDFIEIHIGNQAEDSLGCILVGQEHSVNYVSKSKAAFTALMDKLGMPASISITD